MATEEPPFTATLKEGDFEVREYPSLIAAEVSVKGERGDAVQGFVCSRDIFLVGIPKSKALQ